MSTRLRARARSTRVRLGALLIVLAGTLVYANSLHGPFIFDDHRSIVDNPSIKELWPLTRVLQSHLQSPVAGRPVANLSLAINYAFGQDKVE